MSNSLQYTKRLVSFMVFDQDDGKDGRVSTLEEDASITQIRGYMDGEEGGSRNSSRVGANPMNATHLSTGKQPNQTQKEWASGQSFHANFSRSGMQMPLDRMVKQHTYELIEVLLQMIVENFKMSRTPISAQLSQTLDLVQEKTDAKRVQEIKRQFITDGKIHF